MLARRMLTLLMLLAALAAVGGCGDDGSDGGGGGGGSSVTDPIDDAEQTGENAIEACEDAISDRLDGADEQIALAACRDAGQDIEQATERAREALDKVQNPGEAISDAALQECKEQASGLPGAAGAAAREACEQAIK